MLEKPQRQHIFVEVKTFCLSSSLGLIGLATIRLQSASSRILEQSLATAVVGAIISFLAINFRNSTNRLRPCDQKSVPRVGWASVAACLVTVLFCWMVLNSIDRSNSFYIIRWLGDSEQAVSISDIENRVITSGNGFDYLAVETRLAEHVRRGIVVRDGNSYSLSWIGECIYWPTVFLAKSFSLSGWFGV